MAKKYTQKDKQKRGNIFEQEFRASCNELPCWVWKMRTTFSGTPFDYLLILEQVNVGLELKVTLSGTLPYSAIRHNQRHGLTKFGDSAPQNMPGILVNWRNTPSKINRCFFIPWNRIQYEVCGEKPGSIKLEAYKQFEIPRLKLETGKYGWDLKYLRRLLT